MTWPDAEAIFNAIHEELDEVKTAPDAQNRAEEIGDVLWAVVGLARHYGVDPEQALNNSVQKFQSRWQKMQELAAENSVILADLDPNMLDEYWKNQKYQLDDFLIKTVFLDIIMDIVMQMRRFLAILQGLADLCRRYIELRILQDAP